MTQEIQTMQDESSQLPATTQQPTVLSIIAQMATNPDFDADKMKAMIEMQERINSNEAVISFNRAMAEMQPNIPTIHKKSQGHNSKYAEYEDIEKAVRPVYTDHGFSVHFTSKSGNGKTIYLGTLSHKDGHSIVSEMELPSDPSGSKNGIQAIGSANSYARRYILINLLNIVTTKEDDDGQAAGGNHIISEEQVAEIEDLIQKTSSDKVAFLKWIGFPGVEDIRQSSYNRAVVNLRGKLEKGSKNA